MALVSDDKVKVCGREQRHAVPCFCAVDCIQYGGICREHNTGVSIVLITAQVAQRHIGQIVLEIVLSLLDECRSVSKKQDICEAVLVLPVPVAMTSKALIYMFTYRTDRFFLIIAVCDPVIYGDC